MEKWFEGFVKAAEARGVQDPVQVKALVKLAGLLKAQTENPVAFQAGFDQRLQEKTAGKGRSIANALWALGGGAVVGGGVLGAKGVGRGIHDVVQQGDAEELVRRIAREKTRPQVMPTINRSLAPYTGSMG